MTEMWTCNGRVLREQIGRVLQKEKEQINRKFPSHLSPNCPPPCWWAYIAQWCWHICGYLLPHLFYLDSLSPHDDTVESGSCDNSWAVPACTSRWRQRGVLFATTGGPPHHLSLSRLWCGAADHTFVTPHLVCDTVVVSSSTAVCSSSTPLTQPWLWSVECTGS